MNIKVIMSFHLYETPFTPMVPRVYIWSLSMSIMFQVATIIFYDFMASMTWFTHSQCCFIKSGRSNKQADISNQLRD